MGLVCASVRFVFHLMMVASSLIYHSNALVPTSYLIDCGSPNDTFVGNRVFSSDFYSLSNPSMSNSIFASTQAYYVSSFDSPSLYQTARVFFGPFAYSFPLFRPQHRFFVRLYFFPLKMEAYDLTSARFMVSTQEFILLSNFQATNSSVAVFKEFSLNATAEFLTLTFTPLGSSPLGFVNAVEVVLVPDDLITDNVHIMNLSGTTTYNGLSNEVLETVYRINVGGPKVFPDQDALWRTWIKDEDEFLMDRSLTKSVNYSNTIVYVHGGSTEAIGPDLVYSTGTELVESNTSLPFLNMTWEFNVDAGSSSMIRLHFCDIISKKLNQLYFDVYINGFLGVKDLNLSMFGLLAAPYFTDFVVRDTDGSGKIRVGIGPSSTSNVFPDGILNGLEIMSINTTSKSLNGEITMNRDSVYQKKVVVVLGSVNGVLVVVIVTAVLFMVLKKRRNM